MIKVLFALFLLASPAWAQTNALDVPNNVTVIHIPVEQAEEVSPDRLKARLRIERKGSTVSKMQQEINREMAKAMDMLKAQKAIRVETGYYNSYQQRENNFTSWFASQELVLDSSEAAILLDMVGRLQNDFMISSLEYYLSPAARQAKEQELRLQALANIDAQARAYAQAMKRSSYEIKQVHFQGVGASVPYARNSFARAMSADMVMESAPAVAEAGIIDVRVAGEALVLLKP